MKLINLSIILSSILAQSQVIITRPDFTKGSFSSAPGCYRIYPTVSQIKGPLGLNYEFFDDSVCNGNLIDKANGNKSFNRPVNAKSVRVTSGYPSSNRSYSPSFWDGKELSDPYIGYYSQY